MSGLKTLTYSSTAKKITMATTKKAATKKAATPKPTKGQELAVTGEFTPDMIGEVMDTLSKPGLITSYTELDLPDLDTGIRIPVNMVDEYWSPEAEGEVRRMFFDRIETVMLPPYDDPTSSDLQPVRFIYFIERAGDGSTVQVSQSSARLVSFFENRPRLSAWEIIYQGKKNNSTNNFMSARWGIYPLLPAQKK